MSKIGPSPETGAGAAGVSFITGVGDEALALVQGLPEDLSKLTALITFNKVPLAAPGSISWGYRSGVQPQQIKVRSIRDYVEAALKAAQATPFKRRPLLYPESVYEGYNEGVTEYQADLILQGYDAKGEPVTAEKSGLKFRGSVLLREPVSFNEDSFIFTDDRWRWDRVNVTRDYNLIRKANDQYIFTGSVAQQGLLAQAAKYYLPDTLNPDNGRPWRAWEIVKDILMFDLGYGEDEIGFQIDRPATDYYPQNLRFAGTPASSALSRMLAEANCNLYIDEEGRVVVYSNVPEDLEEYKSKDLAILMRTAVSGAINLQDKTLIRPTKVFVEFEREQEVLLHFQEQPVGRTTASFSNPLVAKTSREALSQMNSQQVGIENVTKTILNDQIPGVPRGVYVPIELALAEFGITTTTLAENYGLALDAKALVDAGLLQVQGGGPLDPNKTLAWLSIVRDYRTCFRIPDVVMRQVNQIRPYLAAIVNPESGLRAPSEVFSEISWLVRAEARVGNETRHHGIDLNSFDGSSQYPPIPANVSIEDTDLGIIRIDYFGELNRPGWPVEAVPGVVDDTAIYVDTIGAGEIIGERQMLNGQTGLLPDWNLYAVVSISRLTPNSQERLKIEAADPPSEIKSGKGPPVHVYSSIDTARAALPDRLKAFRNPAFRASGGGADGFGVPVNATVIKALAESEGFRIWASFADQSVGSVVSRYAPGIRERVKPSPVIQDVTFSVDESGGLYVTASAIPTPTPPNIQNLLPKDILQVALQQVGFTGTVNGQRPG